jgi:hypothetical protein
MKSLSLVSAALTLAAISPTTLRATTATSLSDFDGVEEPKVIYHVSSNSFTNDSYVNITTPSSGTFKFYLRYTSGSSWDGDRTTTSTDRQRAEVRALGTHQNTGETYEYKSTWKTNSSFVHGNHFCHVTQVKAADGDNSAPLIVVTLLSNTGGALQKCSGSDAGLSTVKSFTWAAGTSITTKIRIKPSTSGTGTAQLSVNGGSLSGSTNINLYRPSATSYWPKWGLYRGLDSSEPFGNDYVQHSSVSSTKI